MAGYEEIYTVWHVGDFVVVVVVVYIDKGVERVGCSLQLCDDGYGDDKMMSAIHCTT